MLPCKRLFETWVSAAGPIVKDDIYNMFSPAQKTMFLDLLLQNISSLTTSLVQELDRQYNLSASQNVEILLKWYLLVIRSKTESSYIAAANFATKHGRMKYCRPIFRELARSGELGRALAEKTFSDNKSFYHPIAALMIAKDISN